MLRAAGLSAVYLMPGGHTGPVRVRGVVIGGGDNIDPAHYGAEGDGLAEYDVERDHFEIDILRRVLDTTVPVLGICRGAQLVNVVLGGTLYQDLRPMRVRTPNRNSAFPVKNVTVAAASGLSLDVPLVVRLEGTNVEKGKEILKNSGLTIITADNLADAAEKVVAAANQKAA